MCWKDSLWKHQGQVHELLYMTGLVAFKNCIIGSSSKRSLTRLALKYDDFKEVEE